MSNLQIILPPFAVFLEHTIKNYDFDIQNLNNRKISTNFIAILRAICDSKYNEFLMNLPFSKMIDFTNAWFDKYYIDEKTKALKIYNG